MTEQDAVPASPVRERQIIIRQRWDELPDAARLSLESGTATSVADWSDTAGKTVFAVAGGGETIEAEGVVVGYTDAHRARLAGREAFVLGVYRCSKERIDRALRRGGSISLDAATLTLGGLTAHETLTFHPIDQRRVACEGIVVGTRAPDPIDWSRCLEVLHHHAAAGAVWDGDQISKAARGDLVEAGYLARVDGSGYHARRGAGVVAARRSRRLYALLRKVSRLPVSRGLRDAWRAALLNLIVRAIGPEPTHRVTFRP